jgi:hypothetical protein
MKMMMNKIVFLFLALILSSILFSCNSEKENRPMTKEEKDYRYARIYIDEGVYDMMEKPYSVFDSIDQNAELTVKKATAWDCMKELMTGKAEAIITPMDYTKYWDSVMKKYDVKPFIRMTIAYDALVFYVKFDSPLDSMTAGQIEELLMNKNKSVRDYFPKIKNEYHFVTNSPLSSEAVNLKAMVLKGKKEKRRIYYFPSQDSVKSFVKAYDAIGIGYLSQVIHDPDLRPLRISYIDSNSKYVFPHAVHQANIVRRLYPYIVTHYIYVFSKQKEAAMRLGRYISKHPKSQKYFLNYGIAPAFAKIKLIDEVN